MSDDFFISDNISSCLYIPKGIFNKPVQVEHGPDDTMKYVIGGLVLYMVLKK